MKKHFGIFTILLASALLFKKNALAQDLGDNIIRLSPVTLFYGGIGGSLSFERFIDKNQKVSCYIPVHVGFRSHYIAPNRLYGFSSGSDKNNYSIMIQPGIKMYPKGSHRKINFAMGASVFLTYGTENGYKSDGYGLSSFVQYDKGSEMRIGTTLSPSFTAQITPKVTVGLEAFVGVSLYNKFKNELAITSEQGPIKEMGGASFQLGYRF